jgi:hypothetical protein
VDDLLLSYWLFSGAFRQNCSVIGNYFSVATVTVLRIDNTGHHFVILVKDTIIWDSQCTIKSERNEYAAQCEFFSSKFGKK